MLKNTALHTAIDCKLDTNIQHLHDETMTLYISLKFHKPDINNNTPHILSILLL